MAPKYVSYALLVVSILAIIVAVTVPEIRNHLGLAGNKKNEKLSSKKAEVSMIKQESVKKLANNSINNEKNTKVESKSSIEVRYIVDRIWANKCAKNPKFEYVTSQIPVVKFTEDSSFLFIKKYEKIFKSEAKTIYEPIYETRHVSVPILHGSTTISLKNLEFSHWKREDIPTIHETYYYFEEHRNGDVTVEELKRESIIDGTKYDFDFNIKHRSNRYRTYTAEYIYEPGELSDCEGMYIDIKPKIRSTFVTNLTLSEIDDKLAENSFSKTYQLEVLKEY